MKVVVFGASGMLGQGVVLECLRDAGVEQVVTVGRSSAAEANPLLRNPKLREILHQDFLDFSGMEASLSGMDACFFCLGVSSVGMSEEDYTRVTYGFTMAAAETLARINPGMAFLFISGASTDSTEKGRVMWARVKGRAENALQRLPLQAYMFRPGFVEPMDGILSKTPSYRVIYATIRVFIPLIRGVAARHILDTRQFGQAMLAVARRGYSKPILEVSDIHAVLSASS